MNLYAYVGNDPINSADSTGLAGCEFSTGGKCQMLEQSRLRAISALATQRARLIRLQKTGGFPAEGSAEAHLRRAFVQLYGTRGTTDLLAQVSRTIDNIDLVIGRLKDSRLTFRRADQSGEANALLYGDLMYTRVSQGDFYSIYVTSLYFLMQDTLAGHDMPKEKIESQRTGATIHEGFQLATEFTGAEKYEYNELLELARSNTEKARGNPESFACIIMYGHMELEDHKCGQR